jgi:ABC-type phosphonate transport system ATPase subunit
MPEQAGEPIIEPASSAAAQPLLAVRDVHGWYGESHVLHGIEFDVMPGEVVCLLGRNGAGKTTTLKAIMGILTKRTGSITFAGVEDGTSNVFMVGEILPECNDHTGGWWHYNGVAGYRRRGDLGGETFRGLLAVDIPDYLF